MIDQQDPLIGCRVKWDAFTSAGGAEIPAGEGTHEGASLCRRDDGSPAPVPAYRLTVLDMPRYRANLDRGREPEAWQVVDASYSYATGPKWQQPPGDGMVPSGPWEPFAATMYDNGAKCVLWRRPIRRVLP